MVRNWQRKDRDLITLFTFPLIALICTDLICFQIFSTSLSGGLECVLNLVWDRWYLSFFVNKFLVLLAYVQATPLRRVAMLYLRGHRPRYARPPRSYCHPTQPKYNQISPKSELFARFVCICAYFFVPLRVNCVLWVIISYRQESIVLRLSKAWWGSKHWRRHCVMLYVPTI